MGKGFNLFTTAAEFLNYRQSYCCTVCTTPLPLICMPFCRFRNSTVEEFIQYSINK